MKNYQNIQVCKRLPDPISAIIFFIYIITSFVSDTIYLLASAFFYSTGIGFIKNASTGV